MLQSMVWQRAGHNLVTEQQQPGLISSVDSFFLFVCFFFFFFFFRKLSLNTMAETASSLLTSIFPFFILVIDSPLSFSSIHTVYLEITFLSFLCMLVWLCEYIFIRVIKPKCYVQPLYRSYMSKSFQPHGL